MNILGLIAALISLIKVLPDLWKLIKEIIALIRQLRTDARFDEKTLAPRLAEAIKEIRETRSTKKLEELHQELTDLCGDTGCGVR